MPEDDPDTKSQTYTARLQTKSSTWWKRVLDVQRPYRWNLGRNDLGRTLDIGCGIGRNLQGLPAGSIGVDHNPTSVAIARSAGLPALTLDEWKQSPIRETGAFDSLLIAHVIEHMDAPSGAALLMSYLPWLKPNGRVLFICPQERGYATDATHVRFATDDDLTLLAELVGLRVEKSYSFPFPRAVGRVFPYNEFCVLARKTASDHSIR